LDLPDLAIPGLPSIPGIPSLPTLSFSIPFPELPCLLD
jgi:hypothetical protein